MDWNNLENTVFDDACQALTEIAPKLAHETVLAFCLDCNTADGTRCASINTREGLARTAASYRQYDHYKESSDEEIMAGLRDNPGDFSHFDFVPQRFLNDCGYYKYLESTYEANDAANGMDAALEVNDKEREKFMVAIARVIVRLQDQNRFAALNLAPDFKAFCIDHEEDLSLAIARIERVRQEGQA